MRELRAHECGEHRLGDGDLVEHAVTVLIAHVEQQRFQAHRADLGASLLARCGERRVVLGIALPRAIGFRQQRDQRAVPQARDHLAHLGEPVIEHADVVQHLQLRAGAVVVQQLHQIADADEAVAAMMSLPDRVAQRIGQLGVDVMEVQLVRAAADDADRALDRRRMNGVPRHDLRMMGMPARVTAVRIAVQSRGERVLRTAGEDHPRRDLDERRRVRQRNEHAIDVHQSIQLQRGVVVKDRQIDLDAVSIPQRAPACVHDLAMVARAPARIDVARKEPEVGRIERLADLVRELLFDRAIGDEDQIEVAHAERGAGVNVIQKSRGASAADEQFMETEPLVQRRRDRRNDRGQTTHW